MSAYNPKGRTDYLHKKDIQDVENFLGAFIKDQIVYEKIKAIRNSKAITANYGIEGWLQIEMSLFLEKNGDTFFKKWQREEKIEVSGISMGKFKEKTSIRPDFIFIPNNRNNENGKKILLELKVSFEKDPSKCIKRSIEDLKKYINIKSDKFKDISTIISVSLNYKPHSDFVSWLLMPHNEFFNFRFLQMRNTNLYFSLFWHEYKDPKVFI